MNRIIRSLTIVLVLLLLTGAWFWWNRPQRVDMAAYVPADSLVYVESNNLLELASALMDTEALKELNSYLEIKPASRWERWFTSMARTTGIGSTQLVLTARSQVALVMLDLNSTGGEDTLDYKPLAALVVETHTSAIRSKPAIERLVGDFARRAYGSPTIERLNQDQAEFVRWTSPDGKRQIVVSINGSEAIVGNSQQAVVAILSVQRGQKASLATQPDLQEVRRRVRADALAFGYVSAASAARLLPDLAPLLLLRKLPDEVKKCVAMSSPRILGSVGWTAYASGGGIEDAYSIALKPEVLGRLRPAFNPNAPRSVEAAWHLLPPETFTVTNYNFQDPSAAWGAMNAAIAAAQLDVLCAIGFTELSKKSLIPYGIDEPQSFLRSIKPVLLTAKLDADSARSIVIAGVANEADLRQFVARTFGQRRRTEKVDGQELTISDDEQAAASFVDGYFLLGAPEDIKRCLSGLAQRRPADVSSGWNKLRESATAPEARSVITYAQDRERVLGLITALARFRGHDSSNSASAEIERVVKALPYAVTETKLTDYGLERRTRSPLGQFGAFASLLSPDPR